MNAYFLAPAARRLAQETPRFSARHARRRSPAEVPFRRSVQSRSRLSGYICERCLHSSRALLLASKPPASRDRGPESREKTQTNFGALDVLRDAPPPATAIEACLDRGFELNEGVRVADCGLILLGGEAFKWRPWILPHRSGAQGIGQLLNLKGQFEPHPDAWSVLSMVWPKPDLLIIGTGPSMAMLSQNTRKAINDLGIRLEVQDTRNAAAQFNLLATERGVNQVAAALIPLGWNGQEEGVDEGVPTQE